MKRCGKGHEYSTDKKRCPVCRAASGAAHYAANKDKIAAKQAAYQVARRQSDPIFKLTCSIRTLLHYSLNKKGFTKTSRTADILGCDYPTLQQHLLDSALYNYGFVLFDETYHIDHIVPQSLATTKEELIKLNHYTNLQWLTAEDNLEKTDKIGWCPRDRH